jgi:hypothetical protein
MSLPPEWNVRLVQMEHPYPLTFLSIRCSYGWPFGQSHQAEKREP